MKRKRKKTWKKRGDGGEKQVKCVKQGKEEERKGIKQEKRTDGVRESLCLYISLSVLSRLTPSLMGL